MDLSKRQIRLLVQAGRLALEDFAGCFICRSINYRIFLVDNGFNVFVDRVSPLNERESAFPLLVAEVREDGKKVNERCPADYLVKIMPGSTVQVWRYED